MIGFTKLQRVHTFVEGWMSILPFMSKMPGWRPLFTRNINSNNDWHFISNDLYTAMANFHKSQQPK